MGPGKIYPIMTNTYIRHTFDLNKSFWHMQNYLKYQKRPQNKYQTSVLNKYDYVNLKWSPFHSEARIPFIVYHKSIVCLHMT